MKTKFQLEIHHSGNLNDFIVKMITNHNEGKVTIDFGLIMAFCHADYAIWPSIRKEVKMQEHIGKSLDIWEGKDHTLSIFLKYVPEELQPEKTSDLTDTERDLLTQNLLS